MPDMLHSIIGRGGPAEGPIISTSDNLRPIISTSDNVGPITYVR